MSLLLWSCQISRFPPSCTIFVELGLYLCFFGVFLVWLLFDFCFFFVLKRPFGPQGPCPRMAGGQHLPSSHLLGVLFALSLPSHKSAGFHVAFCSSRCASLR